MTHICVRKLTIIGSDNGLAPGRRQTIIWTNAAILSIRPRGTYFSEILFKIRKFSIKEICLKMSSAKWRPFWLGLNVLTLVKLMACYWLAQAITKNNANLSAMTPMAFIWQQFQRKRIRFQLPKCVWKFIHYKNFSHISQGSISSAIKS